MARPIPEGFNTVTPVFVFKDCRKAIDFYKQGFGAQELFEAFKVALAKRKIPALLTKVGCFGFCAQEPLVNITLSGKPLVILNSVLPKDADSIVKELAGNIINPKRALCKIENWDHLTGEIIYGKGFEQIPAWDKITFFKWQKKIVLRDCGLINPEDIEEYIAVGVDKDCLIGAIHSSSLQGLLCMLVFCFPWG